MSVNRDDGKSITTASADGRHDWPGKFDEDGAGVSARMALSTQMAKVKSRRFGGFLHAHSNCT
jgi:hypothetical protein